MSKNEEGFVTVAECARHLGISDRQALRYVRRVSDTDLKESDVGPTRVRLSAVVALRNERQSVRHTPVEMSDTGPTHDGQESDVPPKASSDLVEQLQARLKDKEAENARLWAALEREQETARAALRELNEERQRGMIMLAATSAGKIGPQETPQTAESTGMVSPDISAGQVQQEVKAEAKPARRWWQFGRGNG